MASTAPEPSPSISTPSPWHCLRFNTGLKRCSSRAQAALRATWPAFVAVNTHSGSVLLAAGVRVKVTPLALVLFQGSVPAWVRSASSAALVSVSGAADINASTQSFTGWAAKGFVTFQASVHGSAGVTVWDWDWARRNLDLPAASFTSVNWLPGSRSAARAASL